MAETDWLAEGFEQHRPRLRAVAYRMLGSLAEAEDAVQETWLRLSRSPATGIDNLGGWLTTVVARECLHLLRSRRRHGADSFDAQHAEPIVVLATDPDPEQEALLADSVGLAMLVVLDRLSPAERLAFVLHDMFELPFQDIAGITGRTPAATRQLASRARRRVHGAEIPRSDADPSRQRRVVDAFYAAARAGDFAALLHVLDPDVVLTADAGHGRPPVTVRGADAVLRLAHAPHDALVHPVLVNGALGALVTRNGQPQALLAFTVAGDRIVAIDGIRDPDRLRRIAPPEFLAATVTPLADAGSP